MTQKCLSINLGFPPLWLVATHSRITERFSPEESQATFGAAYLIPKRSSLLATRRKYGRGRAVTAEVAGSSLCHRHDSQRLTWNWRITPEFPHPDSQTPAELPHRRRASTNLAGDGLYWIGYQEFTHLIDLLIGPGATLGLLLRASVDEHKAVPPGSSGSLLQFLDQRLDFLEIERTCLTSQCVCLWRP
jgi:hypothetical protein